MADLKTFAPAGQQLTVELSDRRYPIYIGRGIVKQLSELLRQQCAKPNHVVLAADSNVTSISDPIVAGLENAGYRVSEFSVPSGEKSKSVSNIEEMWQYMLGEHTDRGSMVVAVGGGVVGDLAGFAAATFARGIPLVQIPTTLLSQVDSSVGGKTGINLPGAKNLVGAFWQPSMVMIDTDHLLSLPRREYVSGLAEVAKYGVIMSPDLFAYLEQNAENVLEQEPGAMSHIVAQSCRCKAIVVEEDERETTGRRAILNYGHTFAHAIENVSGYGTFLHGEAVSIGMHMAATLANQLGRVSDEMVARQETLLRRLELPTRIADADVDAMWSVMQHDKKVEHGKLRFVLPTELGHVELVHGIERSDACNAIECAGEEFGGT